MVIGVLLCYDGILTINFFPMNSMRSLFFMAVCAIAVLSISAPSVVHAERRAIPKDMTVDVLTVQSGNELVMQRGSSLTVNTLTVVQGGKIWCENGPLRLTVKKALVVDGTIECILKRVDAKNKIGNGVVIVIGNSAIFGKESTIRSNGHIQITDEKNRVLTTAKGVQNFYKQLNTDDKAPFGIGAFPESGRVGNASFPDVRGVLLASSHIPPVPPPFTYCRDKQGRIIPRCVSFGHGGPVLPGSTTTVPPPPPGVDRIMLNYDFVKADMEIPNDWTLEGPDGAAGKDDPAGNEKKCNARGGDGGDALGLFGRARTIKIRNFTLRLGNGGRGGNATAGGPACTDATARGGKGGKPGTMKLRALQGISILGTFHLKPGRGGNGGNAVATAQDGAAGLGPTNCVGDNGGDADADGGNGADAIGALTSRGNVRGLANIIVDPLFGGDGGDATANAGHGGDARNDVGAKGSANATGGSYGRARLSLFGKLRGPGIDKDGDFGSVTRALAHDGKLVPPRCGKDATMTPPSDNAAVSGAYAFEFLDPSKGWTVVDSLPFGGRAHVIVASKTADVRTVLPITLTLTVNSEKVWEKVIANNPVANCRDATGCSTDSDELLSPWKTQHVELKAFDKQQKLLTSWKNY